MKKGEDTMYDNIRDPFHAEEPIDGIIGILQPKKPSNVTKKLDKEYIDRRTGKKVVRRVPTYDELVDFKNLDIPVDNEDPKNLSAERKLEIGKEAIELGIKATSTKHNIPIGYIQGWHMHAISQRDKGKVKLGQLPPFESCTDKDVQIKWLDTLARIAEVQKQYRL